MKLITSLTIAGDEAPLVDWNVKLELSAPGRAIFTARMDEVPDQGLVVFRLGYSGGDLYPVFFGTLAKPQALGQGEVELICREICHVLAVKAPLALRHPDATELLKQISELTGLGFVTPPDAGYLTHRAPYFYNLGTAKDAISRFGLWGIEDGIWTQLPDGKIFWGAWEDSLFAKQALIPIPDEMRSDYAPLDRSFSIPAIPSLRPGMAIEGGQRIESIELKGHNMRLTCSSL